MRPFSLLGKLLLKLPYAPVFPFGKLIIKVPYVPLSLFGTNMLKIWYPWKFILEENFANFISFSISINDLFHHEQDWQILSSILNKQLLHLYPRQNWHVFVSRWYLKFYFSTNLITFIKTNLAILYFYIFTKSISDPSNIKLSLICRFAKKTTNNFVSNTLF